MQTGVTNSTIIASTSKHRSARQKAQLRLLQRTAPVEDFVEAGDNAHIPLGDPNDDKTAYAPPLAQFAFREAKVLAGQHPSPPRRPPDDRVRIPVARHHGVARRAARGGGHPGRPDHRLSRLGGVAAVLSQPAAGPLDPRSRRRRLVARPDHQPQHRRDSLHSHPASRYIRLLPGDWWSNRASSRTAFTS